MENSSVAIGAAALLCVVITGCSKQAEEKASEAAVATAVAPRRALTSEDLNPSRSSPTTMATKVYRQLGVEKKNRPQVAPPAERVLAAFEKDGVEAEALKQGLGEPIKARLLRAQPDQERRWLHALRICQSGDRARGQVALRSEVQRRARSQALCERRDAARRQGR